MHWGKLSIGSSHSALRARPSRSVMASLSSSSASRCSSSSFQHSSRYSTSTVRSFSSDSLHPKLHNQFGEESSIRSIANGFEPEQESFAHYHGNSPDESSWDESLGGYQGYSEDQTYTQGGYQGNWSLGDSGIQVPSARRPVSTGVVRAMGDSYFLSADVSGFEPQEVMVLAYNHCVVIHAEKWFQTGADGSVADRFTHKSVLPADMDPLSVSSRLTSEKTLVIRVRRFPRQRSLASPVFSSEDHL